MDQQTLPATAKPATHTPGPWRWAADHPNNACAHVYGPDATVLDVATCYGGSCSDGVRDANARLIAAAPELLSEANILRCLATSPRFQCMTVAKALTELKANGCGHDDGAAIAKATGA